VVREVGISNLGQNVSEGGENNMNVISNPLYDESDVSTGPASQACWVHEYPNMELSGLGSPSVIPDLKYLVRRFNLNLLFLSETLVHQNKIEAFRCVLGFDFCFAVDRTGRSGGLEFF
jgi:hypothetical protein